MLVRDLQAHLGSLAMASAYGSAVTSALLSSEEGRPSPTVLAAHLQRGERMDPVPSKWSRLKAAATPQRKLSVAQIGFSVFAVAMVVRSHSLRDAVRAGEDGLVSEASLVTERAWKM